MPVWDWFNKPVVGGLLGDSDGTAPNNMMLIAAALQDFGASLDHRQPTALNGMMQQLQKLGDKKKYQDMVSQQFAPGSLNVQAPQMDLGKFLAANNTGGNAQVKDFQTAPGSASMEGQGSLRQLYGPQADAMQALAMNMEPGPGMSFVANGMGQMQQRNWQQQDQKAQWDREDSRLAMEPPKSRQIESGKNILNQEWDPVTHTYKTVSTAPRWQPQTGGGAKENWGQPVTEAGPDGRPIVVRYGDRGGRMVVKGAQPKPAQRTLGAKMVNDLVKVGTNLENLDRINNTFQDGYGGNYIMGDAENTARRISGDSTGQAQWWQDYQSYVNQVRNDLFGASLTPTEKSEFEKAIVTPRMAPSEIKKNIERQREISTRAAQRQSQAYEALGFDKQAIDGALGMSSEELGSRATPLATPGTAPLPSPDVDPLIQKYLNGR